MKKGDEIKGTVQTVLFPDWGIVKTEEGEVRVRQTMPGQTVRVRITKKKGGRAVGRLLEVLKPSPLETADPGCSLFPECGGCTYRTLPYEEQLHLKENAIRQLLETVLCGSSQEEKDDAAPDREGVDRGDGGSGKWEQLYHGMRPSPLADAYRNKMEYTFGDAEKDGPLTLGLHKRGSMYDILPATDCRIVHPDFNAIVTCVQDWARGTELPYYHKRTHEGYFRHLLVRRAEKTGEILIGLVTASPDPIETVAKKDDPKSSICPGDRKELLSREAEGELLDALVEKLTALPLQGKIVGILHTVNDSVADTIRSDRTDILFGRDHFYEELLGLRFRITPFSFFQTNSLGAEVLYTTAREMLGDCSDTVIYDLYSGTGTIAQMLAPVAQKVVGVEIVEEAVEAARENAQANGLDRCSFLAGDVLKVLDGLDERPEVIVLDPPRDGIHPKALPKITAYGAERILYISCKASSLARDLPHFLQSGYVPESVACVDMFPATPNIEVVCVLDNKKAKAENIDI